MQLVQHISITWELRNSPAKLQMFGPVSTCYTWVRFSSISDAIQPAVSSHLVFRNSDLFHNLLLSSQPACWQIQEDLA